MIKEQDKAIVDTIVRDLVTARDIGDSRFINLPMLYPDGSNVTVQISRVDGGFCVSDTGFSYREAESIGADRSFALLSKKIAEQFDVETTGRVFSVNVAAEDMYRAICDVAAASWKVADDIFGRASEVDEIAFSEEVRERIAHVFGQDRLIVDHKFVGISMNEWDVSAVVRGNQRPVVFQAVANHKNSIYRASALFGDIGGTQSPPGLVAVVRSLKDLGKGAALISGAGGKIIESCYSDNDFLRVAA